MPVRGSPTLSCCTLRTASRWRAVRACCLCAPCEEDSPGPVDALVELHLRETSLQYSGRRVLLVDVALLRWPIETERRARLATGGLPRLLLVEGDAPPPPPDGCLEDWI